MAVVLAPISSALPQFFTSAGAVLSGGKIYTYLAGTTTPRSAYTDSTGSTAHANPIILDSAGRPPGGIFLTPGVSYKLLLQDSAGNTITTIDEIDGVNDVSATQDQWVASGLTPTYVSASSFAVPGDETTALHVGRRLKVVDSGGTKYGVITASAYTTLTLVTVDVDNAGSLVNPVTVVSYGMLTATNHSVPIAIVSPSQITANQNNYAPSGATSASVLRISSDARRNITGITAGNAGETKVIHNVGTFPIVFKYEDSSSAAANRFAFGHTLSGGHSMTIQYDDTSSRWRCTFKEDPAGMMKDFGGGTAPEGHLACDATAVSRTTYASLFNEIGTTWGVGDGSTTFNLPDSRRRTAVGSGGSGTATLANSVGSTGGAETHTLTEAEMPSHTHATNSVTGIANAGGVGLGGGVSAATVTSNSNTGGGGAHNNVQPSYVVTKVIKF